MRGRGILHKIVNLVIFIILEIAMLHLVTNNADLQRVWVARWSHAFMGTAWGATESVRNYFTLSSENKQLAQENAQLQQDLALARQRLRQARIDTTQTDRHPGYTLTPAEVVKISRNKQHNYLILNRGFEDGIQEKSGIVTSHGVVGIIDAVSEHHAFALSLQNHDISISARIGEEGGSGILVWDGIHSNGALLKEIPLQYHYQPGDTVYTSGHSLLFPPDIPLGVAGDSRVINGATNEITITLFQDFSSVRYVTVVHNDSFDEIEGFKE
jgi:rod shape-determining protein MreC